MQPSTHFPSPDIKGQLKTFGPLGPVYKVLSPSKLLEDGDWLLQIELVETGEATEYRYNHFLNDPAA